MNYTNDQDLISRKVSIKQPVDHFRKGFYGKVFTSSYECSGGVVAGNGCTVRSSIVAFRVADPGFKSRPEHFFKQRSKPHSLPNTTIGKPSLRSEKMPFIQTCVIVMNARHTSFVSYELIFDSQKCSVIKDFVAWRKPRSLTI